MFEYKTSIDPSDLDTSKYKEKVFQLYDEDPNFIQKGKENVDLFFSMFDQYLKCLQNDERDATFFHQILVNIIELGKIFIFDNVIPNVIQSGMFNTILIIGEDLLMDDVCSLLNNMSYCSFDNILMLFKNGLLNYLIQIILKNDEDITQKSINCFSTMLSHEYDIEKKTFIFALIISTNIITIIYDQLSSLSPNAEYTGVMKSFLNFYYIFFKNVPSKLTRNNIDFAKFDNLFDCFCNECQHPQIFNKILFIDILQKSIPLSKDSIYYNTLQRCLSFAAHSKDSFVVSAFCSIIFTLLNRAISTYNVIFDDLKFFDYVNDWVNLDKNIIILYFLALIIGQLFFESYEIVKLDESLKQYIYNMVMFIYDFSAKIIDEDFEIASVCALVNTICFTSVLPPELIKGKRKKRIISKLMESSFRLSRIYSYLCIIIAYHIDDLNEILNFDVMTKIIDNMSIKEGHFVEFALYNIGLIFEKQEKENKNSFATLFISAGGGDNLLEMMDSDNQMISDKAKEVYDKYIKETPNND